MLMDLIGYPFKEGAALLEFQGYSIQKKTTSPKGSILSGEERILRFVSLGQKKVEVLVVKVPLPDCSE